MRLAAAVFLLALQPPAAAGTFQAAQPAPGSAERRSILDALRPSVEARLGRNVEFVVTTIRVDKGWAFVMADPQRRGGRPIDGRAIFGEHFDDMDGLTVTAVLENRGGRWRVVDHAIGATDAWYCGLAAAGARRVTGC